MIGTRAVPRIEDYAMLGNGRSAALVSRDGSVDWLCWPRLDSGAVFARLLGTQENGFWSLRPEGEGGGRTWRAYEKGSMVLTTTHHTATGRVEVIDAMVPGPVPTLIRRVEGMYGRVSMRTEIALRPDYGSTIPWMERRAADAGYRWHAVAGPNLYALHAPVDLDHGEMRTMGTFEILEGGGQDLRPVLR